VQLLDRLDDVPVAVFDATWTLIRYNAFGTVVCGDVACTGWDRNMAWRYFNDTTNCTPETRQDAEEFEAPLVADLRDAASRYPTDPGLRALTTSLRTISTRFRPIRLDGSVLTVSEGELKLLMHTAEPGSQDADKLAALHHAGVRRRSTAGP
jgi:hypothetical protein